MNGYLLRFAEMCIEIQQRPERRKPIEQIAFKTPAPALTAQVNCAYAYAAASHVDAWLAEHFQKQNALLLFG
ncbi:hypothetical protein V6C53_10665 [Desulfocurvibacter africanus]|uniref:hypothetical protein n=1 Tax=Desulfocurvibacter africanus TaxID=873 RepID=UPI002FD982EC